MHVVHVLRILYRRRRNACVCAGWEWLVLPAGWQARGPVLLWMDGKGEACELRGVKRASLRGCGKRALPRNNVRLQCLWAAPQSPVTALRRAVGQHAGVRPRHDAEGVGVGGSTQTPVCNRKQPRPPTNTRSQDTTQDTKGAWGGRHVVGCGGLPPPVASSRQGLPPPPTEGNSQ